ncbi:hypothetical protein [Prochlorococcus marinus]|nr:hypothetical protein [Prochlorococcus marinus]MBO8203694.1 hypothetical protein [Prochlorococcus marinus CUG1415]
MTKKPLLKSLSFLGEEIVINTVDIGSLCQVSYIHQKTPHTIISDK